MQPFMKSVHFTAFGLISYIHALRYAQFKGLDVCQRGRASGMADVAENAISGHVQGPERQQQLLRSRSW